MITASELNKITTLVHTSNKEMLYKKYSSVFNQLKSRAKAGFFTLEVPEKFVPEELKKFLEDLGFTLAMSSNITELVHPSKIIIEDTYTISWSDVNDDTV